MASSKVSDTPNPLASCSVTLPMRTMTNGAMKGPSESNSSSGYMSCLRADIPEIPDIPSPLLRPPASERHDQTNTFASKPSAILPLSSAFAASSDLVIQSDQSADAESSKTPENLDSLIRNQVGRQVDRVFADAVKDFQEHLVSKANEVDKLRVDLQNMEHKEMDMFSGILQKNGIPPQSTFSRTHSSTSTGAPASRAGALGTSTSGYSIPGFQSIGLRETNAQMDDLKRKLKMTTELCAKQDAYYRDIVNDLEKRLKESIAGRDHVLALRESEASGQLKLIQQLEAGLRKQQQIIDSKDESLNSMQASVRQLEENLAAHKSFLDKIRRIASEEDKKRFRSGLVSSALENTASVGQIGDALVELIQKSLFDDDKDKKTLKSSLERVEAEFKRSKELSETRLEELQSENKTRISKLEDEHDQALQLTANRAALVRKELENLQQETAKLKEEHQTVVSAMCRELECLVRELKADLQNAKDKQEFIVLSTFSRTKRTGLTLNEKVHNTEKTKSRGRGKERGSYPGSEQDLAFDPKAGEDKGSYEWQSRIKLQEIAYGRRLDDCVVLPTNYIGSIPVVLYGLFVAVRVAESMQQEVTCHRGELDALKNKG
ncbi:coiled-coil domain-containing protein 158-like [Montipora capricornis]|uniref:coiled-coil domain-containing protein 158-like n=1 Tax=Montipora capricornis TaxID=246305 RepID=UPI0035F1C21D